jgi:signal transduction histidine kinase
VRVATPAFEAPVSALQLKELRPLAEAISSTIGRLRAALELQHRFVGDAAHELKTAVAVVRSSIQVLDIRPRSPEEYRTGMDRVLRDNERVEALLDRMLTLASFEEKRDVSNVRVDMQAEMREALSNLQSLAAACDVNIEFAGVPGLHVRMLPNAVEVLISNLVVNAMQHSPKGGTILVRLREDNMSPKRVVLEVEDAGEGVAPEMLPQVFERFFRADRSRSRQTGGAGLGLAICKSIVEAANGSIEMFSEPERGTVVRATFSLD